VGISTEISIYGIGAAEGRLGVTHPASLVETVAQTIPRAVALVRIVESIEAFELEAPVAPRLFEPGDELAAEELGEDADREEIILRRRDPALAVRSQSAAGDDTVQVWMEAQVAGPSMQHWQQ
jgi:hypothetical protein